MTTRLQRSFAILLVFLLVVMIASSAPAPPVASPPAEKAQEAMPDGLMSALLEASSQPFSLGVDGYGAHSGGLDFALDSTGLQANLGGFILRLALHAWGREGEMAPLPDAQIAQADGGLEYNRGALTEWYRDTALGVEQGFTIHQPPLGAGPLILHLDLSTNLTGTADTDGRGLSFATPDGQTLRYDHLRAWDASGTPLEAQMSYASGQVTLQVDDWEAAYPVTIDPLIYSEQAHLTASDGEAGDGFGYSVALWGETALVGSAYDEVGTHIAQGSVYVFTRTGISWVEQAHLIASDGDAEDYFGRSVALWGNTALVGADRDDVGANVDQGSVYVFTRSDTAWSEQAHLTASDGSACGGFGRSLALWSDTALIGAVWGNLGPETEPGSAYVFTRNGTTWSEQAHLLASDGEPSDLFGSSVALWGDTALVGASEDTLGINSRQGSAYVFTRSGTTWTEQAHLIASDGEAGDCLGVSVALWGDTALVGAHMDDVGSEYDQGSAYVFVGSGATWTKQAHLTASDGGAFDAFGISVALWGDRALVGAYRDGVGENGAQGSAYLYARSGTTWSEWAHLTASDGAAYDQLGVSVALWSNTALAGAYWDTVEGNSVQGSAYIYDSYIVYLPLVLRTMP